MLIAACVERRPRPGHSVHNCMSVSWMDAGSYRTMDQVSRASWKGRRVPPQQTCRRCFLFCFYSQWLQTFTVHFAGTICEYATYFQQKTIFFFKCHLAIAIFSHYINYLVPAVAAPESLGLRQTSSTGLAVTVCLLMPPHRIGSGPHQHSPCHSTQPQLLILPWKC